MAKIGLGLRPPDSGQWWPQGATYAADFKGRRYMRGGVSASAAEAFDFARSSVRYARDSEGAYHHFAAGAPAITDAGLSLEPASVELLRNTSFAGAVAGQIGGSGQMPTSGWTAPSAGLTVTVGLPGTVSGLPAIDLRLQGTPSGNAFLQFETNTQVAAAQGETFTLSAHCYMVAGAATNISSLGIVLGESRADGGDLGMVTNADFLASVATPSLRSATRTMTQANVAYVRAYMRMGLTSGQPIDITLRLRRLGLRKDASVTSPILVPLSSASRASDQLVLKLPEVAGMLTLVTAFGALPEVETSGDHPVNPAELNWPLTAAVFVPD